MSELLDTNVLLRFLVGDSPAQKVQAEKWFAEAEKGKTAGNAKGKKKIDELL